MSAPPKVTLVDYGIGNVFSVRRAFEVCGADVHLTADPVTIRNAERLILPGVGAFADGMRELESRGLVEPIREFVRFGRPFAGICLGMQMMFDESEEFGTHAGLGLIPGNVCRIPHRSLEGQPMKVPHVAWNELLLPKGKENWSLSPLHKILERESVYLVHSFAAYPKKSEHLLAEADYGGHRITAAVQSGSMVGFQFHPERSGPTGLKIIRGFLEM